MEQQTGSKLGKEYITAVYYHPAYLTHIQSVCVCVCVCVCIQSVCVCVCVCVCVRSVVPDPLQPMLPARLLYPWGFSRQEYWTGLPCPPPGDLPNPGIKPRSPTLETDPLPSELLGKCEIHISPCEMPGWMNHK